MYSGVRFLDDQPEKHINQGCFPVLALVLVLIINFANWQFAGVSQRDLAGGPTGNQSWFWWKFSCKPETEENDGKAPPYNPVARFDSTWVCEPGPNTTA